MAWLLLAGSPTFASFVEKQKSRVTVSRLPFKNYEIGLYSLDAIAASDFFLFELSLNLLFFSRFGALDILGRNVPTTHLPFHELVECALWIRAELLVGAFFGYSTVSIDADDTVRALDCRQAMCDANSCIVLLEEFVECLVDKSLRLGIECTCCLVEDENVGLLDECSCNGDTLFLAS